MSPLNALLGMLLLCSTFGNLIAEHDCKNMLHSLAASQQDYVRCSTKNAVPVKLCMGCKPQYDMMQESYNNLKSSPNCSKEYFDHDRINVVQTTQNMLLGLWKKAYCDDCLNKNNSITFTEKLGDLNYCLDKYIQIEEKCIKCVYVYTDLNNFYKSLDQHNNGQVCYDLQDSMNQTRLNWSKNLKCCHREFQMTLFLLATISVGSLPIIFYTSAYILTKRRERNHAVLNIAEDVDENRRIDVSYVIEQTPTVSEQPERAAILKKDNIQHTDDENVLKI